MDEVSQKSIIEMMYSIFINCFEFVLFEAKIMYVLKFSVIHNYGVQNQVMF